MPPEAAKATHAGPLTRWRVRTLASALLALVAVCMAAALGTWLDRAQSDAFFRARGAVEMSPEIVIVGIDDASFKDIDRQWPWPRRLHAQLLDNLRAAGARSVVFDILFDTPARDPEDDRLFSQALERAPNTVLATARSIEAGAAHAIESWAEPTPSLMLDGTAVGGTNVLADEDEVVRTARRVLFGRPTLAAAAASAFAGEAGLYSSLEDEQTFMVNFVGPAGTFPMLSYYRALSGGDAIPHQFFRDKLVLVGAAASASAAINRVDHFRTPFEAAARRMSGAELHANIAYNLLHDTHVRRVPARVSRCAALLGVWLLGIVLLNSGPVRAAGAVTGVAAVATLASFGAFDALALYVPVAEFVAALGVLLVCLFAVRYIDMRRRALHDQLRLAQSEERIRAMLAMQETHDAARDSGREAQPVRVFISYRHKAEDAAYMAEILEYMKGLERDGIVFWTDEELLAGERWDSRIKQQLARSQIGLVLVSQAFLDSSYCVDVEVKALLDGNVTLMPIMLSPCDWQAHPWLASRQFLPGGSETLAEHYVEVGARQRMLLRIRKELSAAAARIRREGVAEASAVVAEAAECASRKAVPN